MESHNFHQRIKKRKNQNKILELLQSEEKSYTQLELELKLELKSSFTHTTLAKHIKELLATREIELVMQNGKRVYKLGDKGIINPADIMLAANYLKNIKKRGGIIQYGYSHLEGSIISSSLPWGILSYLVMDKDLKNIKLLTREDVGDIEKLIFDKIKHNIKNDKWKGIITQGNFQLGFNVDYAQLLESFNADSLEYYATSKFCCQTARCRAGECCFCQSGRQIF
jgi:arginine repressor